MITMTLMLIVMIVGIMVTDMTMVMVVNLVMIMCMRMLVSSTARVSMLTKMHARMTMRTLMMLKRGIAIVYDVQQQPTDFGRPDWWPTAREQGRVTMFQLVLHRVLLS